jgi:solute:Na+ symporter, SSS family
MHSLDPMLLLRRPPLGALALQDKGTVFAVIAGYLMTLIIVGLVFRRFSRDTSDYFRAGGKAAWWLIGGSVFMRGFSAWTFTGAAGAAFQAGWSLPMMFGANVVAFLTVAAISGGWFRQLRCITSVDMIRLRYGPGLEQFAAYLGMLTGPIYGGIQLYGLAIFTSILLETNMYYTIILLGLVVLFYAGISGAWAVMAADFVKALVLVPITVLLAVICLRELGGIGGLLDAIRGAGLSTVFAPVKTHDVLAAMNGVNPGWFTWAFFFAWYGNAILLANEPSSAGRYLSAKDGAGARRAALLAGCLFTLGLFIWFIPPMTARLLIAGDVGAMPLPKPAEGAYAAIAIHFLPAGLVGLVLVGMCAATMSALDVGLNSLAGNITQNVYPAACRALGRAPLEGRARLLLARLVTVCCAFVVIFCALGMARFGRGGIFNILIDVMATVAAPLSVPLVLGLFMRRVPAAAPFVSIAAGFAVSLTIYLAPLLSGAKPWVFQSQVGTVVAVSLASFLLVRALGTPDEATLAREREYFSRRDRPVDFAAETGEGNDGRQLRIVGAFGVVLGLAILLLLFPASSAGHAGNICAVAFSTFAIGAVMVWLSFRSGRTDGSAG